MFYFEGVMPLDPMPQLPNMLKVIKSVYGDRKQLEKSLKNAAGTNLDRVRGIVCDHNMMHLSCKLQMDAESMRQLRASQG